MVRPGGLVGFSFWGSPKRLGLLPFFATLVELSPPSQVEATLNQGDTGRPGVAEQMLADAGLEFVAGEPRRSSTSGPTLTWPYGARLGRAVLAGPAGGWLRPVRRGDARGDSPAVHRGSGRPDRLRVRLGHRAGPRRLMPATGRDTSPKFRARALSHDQVHHTCGTTTPQGSASELAEPERCPICPDLFPPENGGESR